MPSVRFLWFGMGLVNEIAEIVTRWRGPAEKGFCVKTADGQAFDLTYRELPDEWYIQPMRTGAMQEVNDVQRLLKRVAGLQAFGHP